MSTIDNICHSSAGSGFCGGMKDRPVFSKNQRHQAEKIFAETFPSENENGPAPRLPLKMRHFRQKIPVPPGESFGNRHLTGDKSLFFHPSTASLRPALFTRKHDLAIGGNLFCVSALTFPLFGGTFFIPL